MPHPFRFFVACFERGHAELAYRGFERQDAHLQRRDRLRVQAGLEVFLVDPIVNGRKAVVRHSGNRLTSRP